MSVKVTNTLSRKWILLWGTIILLVLLALSVIQTPDATGYSTEENKEFCSANQLFSKLYTFKIYDVCPPQDLYIKGSYFPWILGALSPYPHIFLSMAYTFFFPCFLLYLFFSSNKHISRQHALFASLTVIVVEGAFANSIEKKIALKLMGKGAERPLGHASVSNIGFPSGHSTSTGGAVGIVLASILRPQENYFLSFLLIVFSVCVASSRVATGYHTIFQVMVGLTIGMIRGVLHSRFYQLPYEVSGGIEGDHNQPLLEQGKEIRDGETGQIEEKGIYQRFIEKFCKWEERTKLYRCFHFFVLGIIACVRLIQNRIILEVTSYICFALFPLYFTAVF